MNASRSGPTITRRAAIAGGGAAGTGIALSVMSNPSSAQSDELAVHPLTGTWLTHANALLTGTQQVPHIAQFRADGTVLLMVPPSDIGPDGPILQSACVGIWEAHDARRGHFNASQSMCDFDGNVVNVVTVDGYPLVSGDGESFEDDGELVIVTIRDATGVVVDTFPGVGANPVRGRRLTFETAMFPESLGETATPTN